MKKISCFDTFFNLLKLTSHQDSINLFLNSCDDTVKRLNNSYSITININSDKKQSSDFVGIFNKLLTYDNLRIFFNKDQYQELSYYLLGVPKEKLCPISVAKTTTDRL